MNKTEFIEKLSKELDTTKTEANKNFDAVIKCIAQAMKDNDEYLTTDNSDLLPNASIIPMGKQNIKEKNETINVNDNPPHAPVSTHSKPNSPPEIK